MTSESGSDEPSGATTITERQVCGLTRLRSNRSVGSPLRQMILVLPRLGALSAISSSISTLSLLAMMTMRGRWRLALAIASSERMSKIDGDQFRITVWSTSSTRERPFRRPSRAESSPALMIEMRAEKTRMPIRVTNRVRSRKGQPVSPPMVPASIVRIRDCQAPSTNENPPSGPIWVIASTVAATKITVRLTRASQPTRAIGPAPMLLSNS